MRPTPAITDVIKDDRLASNPQDYDYYSAMLTRNGSTSLILTVPQEIWMEAGVDHADPGSVSLFHYLDSDVVVMAFGRR